MVMLAMVTVGTTAGKIGAGTTMTKTIAAAITETMATTEVMAATMEAMDVTVADIAETEATTMEANLPANMVIKMA